MRVSLGTLVGVLVGGLAGLSATATSVYGQSAGEGLPAAVGPAGPVFPVDGEPATLSRLPPVEPLAQPPGGASLPGPQLLEAGPLDAAVAPDAVPEAGAAAEPDDAAEPLPGEAELPRPKLWEGNFQLGLDGTEGSSQTFNLRFASELKRETERNVAKFKVDYRKATNQSEETAHRLFIDWKDQLLFVASPWTCHVHGTVDYDEFELFDVRVTADVGLGYHFIKTPLTTVAGRAGGGFSHEVGGPDRQVVPEAAFGADFEQKLGKRHKLKASVDYAPDVTDFSDFRVNSEASWEALLDERMNLSLKLRALDRYDNTPRGPNPNQLDYSAMLMWSF
jgi:putative salt-induced outer membrane protein YdiY